MPNVKRNALAELAERMAVVTSGHGDTWRWLEDVSKAQRIIAELAKIPYVKTLMDGTIPLPVLAMKSIEKCRAIAEEERNETDNVVQGTVR